MLSRTNVSALQSLDDIQPYASANSLLVTSYSYTPVNVARDLKYLVTAAQGDDPFLVILAPPSSCHLLRQITHQFHLRSG